MAKSAGPPELQIVHYYPRALVGDGGVSQAVWGWSTALLEQGIEVSIMFNPRLGHHSASWHDEGVTLIPVRRPWDVLRAALRIRQEAAHHATAVVLLHSVFVPMNLFVSLCFGPRRTIWVPHGGWHPMSLERRHFAKKVWRKLIDRPILSKSLALHLFTEDERDHAQYWIGSDDTPIIVAPHGVELPSIAWDPAVSLGYLVWIGRYDIWHKGLDILLSALESIPGSERPRVRLYGRDSTDERLDVERLAQKLGLSQDVSVGGPIEGVEKETILLEAGGYLHLSRYESFGLALTEALSLGLPCLVSDQVGLAEELRVHDAARITALDIPSVADAIRGFVQMDPQLLRPREYVSTELDWGQVSRRFLDQLQAIILQRHPRYA